MNIQKSLTLLSPCKINLFLHINGRRSDDYHLLQTYFQLLDYGDQMIFESNNNNDTIELIEHSQTTISYHDNLIIKAAHLLKEKYQINQGIRITIDKQLPIGGGLGGGSSNAATTLLALNQLWQLNLTINELAVLGLSLGADVPIFIRGQSAWAEGIGEKITPINYPNQENSWFIIVHPNIFVSTGEIFSSETLTRNTEICTIAAFLKNTDSNVFKNDCEPVVRARYPKIDNAIKVLSQFSSQRNARLTGTGACIFLQCASQREAQTIVSQLPSHWYSFIARGVKKSPVHKYLSMID